MANALYKGNFEIPHTNLAKLVVKATFTTSWTVNYGAHLVTSLSASSGVHSLTLATAYADIVGCQILLNNGTHVADFTDYTASTGVLRFTTRSIVHAIGPLPTGSITCLAKASLADTDYLTIGDGVQPPVVYELDVAGDGVTAGRTQVDVSGDTTASDVAQTLESVINATQPAFSTAEADGVITLTHKIAGTVGVVTITENVANAGFLVSGMTAGTTPVAAAANPANPTVALIEITAAHVGG